MALKFYTSVGKGLKLKVRKLWGLIPMFVKVTEEKLLGGVFWIPILNKVKLISNLRGSFKIDALVDNFNHKVEKFNPKYYCPGASDFTAF